MDHSGRAGDAVPRPQSPADAPAAFIFEEDGKVAFENEEYLLDLMGVGGVPLPGRHIHDAEREGAGLNDIRIAVLA